MSGPQPARAARTQVQDSLRGGALSGARRRVLLRVRVEDVRVGQHEGRPSAGLIADIRALS